jgi:hypothetical protein
MPTTMSDNSRRSLLGNTCVFFGVALKLYNSVCGSSSSVHPCGGGVRYLHRDPASRRRRQQSSLKYKTVKYGHEAQGTRSREILRWRGPAAYTKDRHVLSSERALHKTRQ